MMRRESAFSNEPQTVGDLMTAPDTDTLIALAREGRIAVVPVEATLPPMPDDDRIRKLLRDCGFERSMSLYQAFKQVIKETRLALGDTAWPSPAPGAP